MTHRIHTVHSDAVLARKARKRIVQHGRTATVVPHNWTLHAVSLVIVLGATGGWMIG